jgi:zinc transporter 2
MSNCKQHTKKEQEDFECHDCEVDDTHDEASIAARKKLIVAASLCILFMITEAVGGIMAGSLAILTDAAHLASDLAGFLISVFALWLTSRKPTNKLSYGFHRAEIIGALLSVFMIWAVTGVLIWEAVQRIQDPQPVDGRLMLIIAGIGFVVNTIMAYVLHGGGHGHSHGDEAAESHHEHEHEEEHHHEHEETKTAHHDEHEHGHHGHGHDHDEEEEEEHGHHDHAHGEEQGHGHSHGHAVAINDGEASHKEPLLQRRRSSGHGHHENLNIRAALIHVIGDMAQSFGVIIAAGIIWYKPEWTIVDPICTILFAIIVLFTTFRLVSDSFHILMEGTPKGIDRSQVFEALSKMEQVSNVHDLHIWSITSGKPSLSVHLTLAVGVSHSMALRAAQDLLNRRFNICHTTIQIEEQQ